MKILHVAPSYGWWGRLKPSCLDDETGGQVGGGENALLYSCFGLARLGHEVHCAFRCEPGRYRGVRFHDLLRAQDLVFDQTWDAVVSWDDAEFLMPLDGSGPLLILSNQMNSMTPWAASSADVLVSPSRTHARLLSSTYGVPIEKFAAIPNGVDPARFDFSLPRDPYRVYYASSPDRGLHHLLRLWPEVKRAVPDAHLHVYYEIERWAGTCELIRGWSPELAALAEEVRCIQANLRPSDGIVFEGAVHPRQVARDACRSAVMAYPCDTVFFTEGFGTAVLEAYVAGAHPIVTDTDAFAEVYGDAIPLSPLPRDTIETDFAPTVIHALEAMKECKGWAWQDAEEANRLASHYSWDRVADLWHRLLTTSGASKPWWPE